MFGCLNVIGKLWRIKMVLPVNSYYYNKMTDEDIEWLKEKIPEDSFYRSCIIERMEMAKKYYAEVILSNLPEEAWEC
jgi:hypothetical protein